MRLRKPKAGKQRRRRVIRHGGRGKLRAKTVRQRSPEMDPFRQGTGHTVKSFIELRSFRNQRPDKPIIAWIYADWCGHCRSFITQWRSMVRAMRDTTFVTVDGSSGTLLNDMAGYPQVTGYPTLWLFAGGDNSPVVYRGERTADAIKQALEKASRKGVY